MSIVDRIRRFFERQSDSTHNTAADRIDAMSAAHDTDHLDGGYEGGGLPPNYLPTGVDEGRPKK